MAWFIFLFVQILSYLFTYKILIQDFQTTLKEMVIMGTAAAMATYFFESFSVFVTGFSFTGLCLVFFYEKGYSFKKSTTLAASTIIIGVLFDHVSTFIRDIFDSPIQTNAHLENLEIDILHLFIHQTLVVCLSVLFSIVLVKLTQKWREKINQNEGIQTLLMAASLVIVITFYANIILGIYHGNTIEVIQLNLLFFAGYLLVSTIAFYFYAKMLQERYAMERQKEEQERLKQYTVSIENQYHEMRKFKHDYQNVLLSIGTFIQENDLEGLHDYYLKGIKSQSKRLLDDARLMELRQIYKREVHL